MTEEQLKNAAECWHTHLAVSTDPHSPTWCLKCRLHVPQSEMAIHGGFHQAAPHVIKSELASLEAEAKSL